MLHICINNCFLSIVLLFICLFVCFYLETILLVGFKTYTILILIFILKIEKRSFQSWPCFSDSWTKAFLKFFLYIGTGDKFEVEFNSFWLSLLTFRVVVRVVLKKNVSRTHIHVTKPGLLSLWQPLIFNYVFEYRTFNNFCILNFNKFYTSS